VAPRERLTKTAYNVGAFNPSAEEVREVVVKAFPDAEITYNVDRKRQGIVDSWPADVNDCAAHRDWGFAPQYDFERAFAEYLIPTIRERYR
jgi:nucleoside-diphosphate-sugar epimerase